MATARQQPPWQAPPAPPGGTDLPPLKIYNSLTRSKADFVPLKAQDREVSWYACGPTVYDDAHLGHARNYVTTDIIRRIMRDYFKFKVKFVMNITDVDDKIILRGRQRYLLGRFKEKNNASSSAPLEATEAALKAYLTKNLPLVAADVAPENVHLEVKKHYAKVLQGGALGDGAPGDAEAKIKMHINTVVAASKAVQDLKQQPKADLDLFYEKAQDVLLPYLDSLHGSSIDSQDHSIFTNLTKTYEARFMEDVRSLNCLDPDVVTRVTEYGHQIVQFVERIQKNGFAYPTSDGSVYFDIAAFEAANNNYARLEPWNRNDKDLQADGEGSLTNKTTEKKSDADFALWKSSKPGEPSWTSPWGQGRPGWHIECSAMASDVLGSQFDIHSGGIDLAFPHHDNELAQSEAYWVDKSHTHPHQWVNYFMHMGHLSIQGSKMSKSLKNFTTIRDALAKRAWSPRSLRIVFLHGGWKEGIEVTDEVVTQGAGWEAKVNENFFIRVNDLLRRRQVTHAESNGKEDDVLKKALDEATTKAHNALCDSFNTNAVVAAISELASTFFTADESNLSTDVVRLTAHWITRMVRIFGLDDVGPDADSSIGWSGVDIPAGADVYVYPLSEARDALRRKARSPEGITPQEVQALNVNAAGDVNEKSPFAAVAQEFNQELTGISSSSANLGRDVLALCDWLRDASLFDLGVYLEDRDGDQPALVRPVTKELLDARSEKEAREAEKVRRKEEAEQKAREQLEKGRMSHVEMFKTEEARKEYADWDADGVPTKDAEGKELPKSKTKKLRKDWERQKKAHEAWLKAQGGG